MTDEKGEKTLATPPGKPEKAAARSEPKARAKKGKRGPKGKRTRTPRIYPALTFEECLRLAEAIHVHASGERVSRLTLLKAMNLSPTSSATQILITSSAKYGLTKGSFVAEHLELTEKGKLASDKDAPLGARTQARFDLAISAVLPFDVLYQKYKNKRLPSQDVMRDVLKEAGLEIADFKECLDTFVVNAKFLGLLQTIAGSETLVSIETLLEQLGTGSGKATKNNVATQGQSVPLESNAASGAPKWDRICFYITPIGDEGTEERKHSDLFLAALIEPALAGFGLDVVRADMIDQPGMITSQVLEHILRAKLVIADLSYHNPNVFYEVAIRHAIRLPVVQISRKKDRLPFDVNQVRTVTIDTTDIYSLVPKLETHRSEIASQVRAALDGQGGSNPISVFFPGVTVKLPSDAV